MSPAREVHVPVGVAGWPTVLGGTGMTLTVGSRHPSPFIGMDARVTAFWAAMTAAGWDRAFVEDVLRQAVNGYLGRDPVDTIPERDHRGHLLWLHRSGTRGAGQ
jgi:hypothetical protein